RRRRPNRIFRDARNGPRRAHPRGLIGTRDVTRRRQIRSRVLGRTRSRRLRVLGAPDSERLSGLVEGPRGAIALVIGYVGALQRPGSVVPIHIQTPFGGGSGSHRRRNRHRGNYSDRGLHDRPPPFRFSAPAHRAQYAIWGFSNGYARAGPSQNCRVRPHNGFISGISFAVSVARGATDCRSAERSLGRRGIAVAAVGFGV